MELQEYQNRLSELEKRYQQDQRKLIAEYAFANNPYKVGDLFTDHVGTIRIEKIQATVPYLSADKAPSCVYTGMEVKADGTPMKKGKVRGAYQTNEKKKS